MDQPMGPAVSIPDGPPAESIPDGPPAVSIPDGPPNGSCCEYPTETETKTAQPKGYHICSTVPSPLFLANSEMIN